MWLAYVVTENQVEIEATLFMVFKMFETSQVDRGGVIVLFIDSKLSSSLSPLAFHV